MDQNNECAAQLLRRQVGALLRPVKVRPVFRQLIPAVLGRIDPARGVERDAFAVAQAGGEALSGREHLARAVGVIAPDSSAGLELLTDQVPKDIAANVFANVGSVEISEHRAPNFPRVKVRRCEGREEHQAVLAKQIFNAEV